MLRVSLSSSRVFLSRKSIRYASITTQVPAVNEALGEVGYSIYVFLKYLIDKRCLRCGSAGNKCNRTMVNC